MNKNPLGKVAGGMLASRGVKAESDTAEASKVKHAAPTSAVPGAEMIHGKRRRGSTEVVSLTVRLRREDWAAMNEIKSANGMSQQEQFLKGLAMWFDHNGKAPPKAP